MRQANKSEAVARAKKIEIILFDVDGVLTDGTIWIVPAPSTADNATAQHIASKAGSGGYGIHSHNMVETKGFNAYDGTAISLARGGGITCGIITKRVSEVVALRARDLKLEYVYLGQSYKMQAVREIMAKSGKPLEAIAYVGDDIIDLPVMRECGLAIAPATARDEVKAAAHFITEHGGGRGAGRDAVEFILRAQGTLEDIIERYIDERHPEAMKNDIGEGNM
jgi:3-deoxy-D-manno-octulosonate 8-phosphate phosphatase (KDO 8-P phosphatase)